MNRYELEERTLRLALKVIESVGTLPHSKAGEVIEFQLVKAGTSVGSNYREANRAESRKDFIHKIRTVEKESSESKYWLELCDDAGFGEPSLRDWLLNELLAIFISTSKTSKRNRPVKSKQVRSA